MHLHPPPSPSPPLHPTLTLTHTPTPTPTHSSLPAPASSLSASLPPSPSPSPSSSPLHINTPHLSQRNPFHSCSRSRSHSRVMIHPPSLPIPPYLLLPRTPPTSSHSPSPSHSHSHSSSSSIIQQPSTSTTTSSSTAPPTQDSMTMLKGAVDECPFSTNPLAADAMRFTSLLSSTPNFAHTIINVPSTSQPILR
ncbi:unnamed protein product [Hymenolepis diminuta]|uniref:Uncharacterized protein n=1 Tax=Hymenolepis diminuta TaxID=6216 RepID=A0A3P6ZQ67_HYMDI|nr:unnamed protein product [Hymenolepis diminuta]